MHWTGRLRKKAERGSTQCRMLIRCANNILRGLTGDAPEERGKKEEGQGRHLECQACLLLCLMNNAWTEGVCSLMITDIRCQVH